MPTCKTPNCDLDQHYSDPVAISTHTLAKELRPSWCQITAFQIQRCAKHLDKAVITLAADILVCLDSRLTSKKETACFWEQAGDMIQTGRRVWWLQSVNDNEHKWFEIKTNMTPLSICVRLNDRTRRFQIIFDRSYSLLFSNVIQ